MPPEVRSPEHREILRLLLGAAVLVTFALVAYAAAQARLRTERDALANYFEVDEKAAALLSALQDAETGQRGYLLTTNPAYLAPYADARARAARRLGELDSVLRAGPAARADTAAVARLSALSASKFAELAETIRLRRAGHPDSALALVNTDVGKGFMDDFRGEIAAVTAGKSTAFARTRARVRRLERLLAVGLGLSALALGGLCYAVYARVDPLLARIDASRAALRRKNEQLENFAYIASHDLNEPLRTLAGFVEVIREDFSPELTARASTYLGFITDATQRLRVMIDGLLAYARLGRTGGLTEVDLDRVLGELATDLSERLAETDARLELGPLPAVRAREPELRQVFQNLLLNGLKFARRGVRPEIGVSAVDRADRWEFAVADNGIGIAPERLDEIFRMFAKLHRAEEYAGHGIGLAFCRRIVEGHGGAIWVASAPGDGSTFRFTLPKRPPDDDEAP